MSTTSVRAEFSTAATDWLCRGYGLVVRYIGIETPDGRKILAGSLHFQPIAPVLYDFSLRAGLLSAGQHIFRDLTKREALAKLKLATQGCIADDGLNLQFSLPGTNDLDFHSDIHLQDRWFTELHLKVAGTRCEEASSLINGGVEHALRSAVVPFDGLNDLCAWLDFDINSVLAGATSISIRVNSPVVLEISACGLAANEFQATLKARARFDVRKLTLSARYFPGKPADSRLIAGSNLLQESRGNRLAMELKRAF